MSRWAIYNSATGRIYGVYSGTEAMAAMQLKPGESFAPIAEGLFDTTAYVSGGEVLEKQPFTLTINKPQIIANGNDTATISGIPAGAKCTWHDGQENIINDGLAEMATDLPGTYTLTFDAVPYLRQEVTIEAVAAA